MSLSQTQIFNEALSAVRGHLDFLKENGLTEIPASGLPTEPKAASLPLATRIIREKQAAPVMAAAVPKTMANELSPEEKRAALVKLRDEVLPCIKCATLATGRTHVVFGSGSANARLCFVGEAPGREEDLQGLPFVGEAGQLLTKIIESIGLKRDQVFIANVLKCRPPGNRNPEPDEIANCQPFLFKQLDIIRPRIICALGKFSAQTLLKSAAPISALRGKFFDFQGAKLIATFHPAYLLRNPEAKTIVWEDMKKIRAELARLL